MVGVCGCLMRVEVGQHDALWIRSLGVGVRVCGYHDALPRQILVHKDVVGWETPKKTEVRHFVHVALEPQGQSLRNHPPRMGEPT